MISDNNGTDINMNISSSNSSSAGSNYQTRKFRVDDDHNNDDDTTIETYINIPVRMITKQPNGEEDDAEEKRERGNVSERTILVISMLFLSIIIGMIMITLSMTTGVDFAKIMTLL